MNLRDIPGTSYPLGDLFSHFPMPADSPYACSWWYRTTFATPARLGTALQGVILHFQAINYRANIWLNGKKIAVRERRCRRLPHVRLRYHGGALAKGGRNTLAVEVFAPSEKELGINWVDWNPAPADKDMGLWGKVYLEETGGVEIVSLLVVTHFAGGILRRPTFLGGCRTAQRIGSAGERRAACGAAGAEAAGGADGNAGGA